MAQGDHIRVYRTLYWHHGIDAGDGTVIHFTGEPGRSDDARIHQTPREDFLRGGEPETVRHRTSLPPDQVLTRAASRLGESGYHVLYRNCEHFARWCVGRSPVSRQVEWAAGYAAAAGLALRYAARRSAPSLLRSTALRLSPVGNALLLSGAALGLLSRLQARGRHAPTSVDPSRPVPELVQAAARAAT